MKHLMTCLALAALASSAYSQNLPKKEDSTTYRLSLKVAGPPVPSFRYELVPTQRDRIAGNAALLHHRALHILGEHRPAAKEQFEQQERFYKALESPLAGFPKEGARTFLKPYANVFREMEAAAKCDHCDWGIEQRLPGEAISDLLPVAQKMRELAFLLRLRCRLHIAEGKFEPALKDIQTGLVLGRHAAQGPSLIHYLIGNAIATMFVAELEQVMQLPICPNLYWSLTGLPRPLIDMKKGVAGEVHMMEGSIPIPKDVDKGPMTPEAALAALDKLLSSVSNTPPSPENSAEGRSRIALAFYVTLQNPTARKSLRAAGKTDAELDAMPPAQIVLLDLLVRFRNFRDEHFVWFNAPYAEAMQGMRQSEARLRGIRNGQPPDFLNSMLLMLLPAVDRVFATQMRTERRLASLRVVEAIRLHAFKNDGSLPDRLSDVTVVPLPLDPATNQPFHYSIDGNSFTLDVGPPPDEKPVLGNHWKYVVTVVK